MDGTTRAGAGLVAALAGVALHIVFFRRSEHHMHGVRYLQATLLASGLATTYLVRSSQLTLGQALSVVTSLLGSLLAGVFASLLAYRLLLHPLRSFPGPPLARVSGLWYSVHVRRGDAHTRLLALHRRYGAAVRIGPSDLSVASAAAVPAVYAAGSRCRKGAWYDTDAPRISMHTSRNPAFHAHRRRLWGPAFGDAALRGYEARVRRHNDLLATRLAEAGGTDGKPVNATRWLNWWAFDVMGDVAFSRDFGMLDRGEEHWAVQLLHRAMQVHAFKLPVWLARVLLAVPGLAADYWRFMEFCDGQLAERVGDDGPKAAADVMTTLLPTVKSEDERDSLTLQSDSRLLIVAGSDTTAATITNVFYRLSQHPEHQDRLRRELAGLVAAGAEIEHQAIQKAEHLNGVMYETLRLNPVPPTMLQRVTPPEGLTIGDIFVPGDMNVFAPQYVLGRDETIYSEPERFVPERWYSRPEMIKNKDAFAPFSIGPYGCIGKPLALMELRTAISTLLRKFDVEFAPGDSKDRFFDDTQDQFVLWIADLYLRFKPRST